MSYGRLPKIEEHAFYIPFELPDIDEFREEHNRVLECLEFCGTGVVFRETDGVVYGIEVPYDDREEAARIIDETFKKAKILKK